MLKRWLFYLFSLAGAIAFYGAYTKYISFYILAAVLLLPLFSLLISLPAMVRMRVEYSMLGGEVVRGDEARLEVKLRQRWIYTLPEAMLRYSDTNITLTKEIRQKTSYIGTDSCVSIPIDTSHVGCRLLVIEKIRIYDYLGLFFRSVKPPADRRITVMPIPETPEPMPTLPAGETAGSAVKPKPGGGFSEDHDLRPYREGDPMNLVHWKLSSKHDELIVRESLVLDKGNIRLIFSIPEKADELDSVFGQIDYLANIFIARMEPLYMWCLKRSTNKNKKDDECDTAVITDRQEYIRYLSRLLAAPEHAANDNPKAAPEKVRKIDWSYHVVPNLTPRNESGKAADR